jgi:hypothetical protein
VAFSQDRDLTPQEKEEMKRALIVEYSPSFHHPDPKDEVAVEAAKVNCTKIKKFVYMSLRNNGISHGDAAYFANFVYEACEAVFNGK